MDERARRYASAEHRKVQGWLTRTAAQSIAALADVQERQGIRGGACEIGVHHGKLFILLCLLLKPGERALAVDLFELQSENVDGSGLGSRVHLERNLARFGVRANLMAENSMRLTADRILNLTGPVRLFSVDGGHTAEITYNDLSIASEVACEGGLVILDDYFSTEWPGVTEGACEFMRERKLSPVGYVSNKLILVRGDNAPYIDALGGEPVEMFGSMASVVRDRSMRERLARTALWRSIRSNRLGAFVRHVSRYV